jgi:hypothetical protein
MQKSMINLVALMLITLMITSCGTLSRSTTGDSKSPSMAEQINIRRDRH